MFAYAISNKLAVTSDLFCIQIDWVSWNQKGTR